MKYRTINTNTPASVKVVKVCSDVHNGESDEKPPSGAVWEGPESAAKRMDTVVGFPVTQRALGNLFGTSGWLWEHPILDRRWHEVTIVHHSDSLFECSIRPPRFLFSITSREDTGH
jgi:hypothetical protein